MIEKQDAKVDERLKVLAVESEVQKRLDAKSSKYDYGSLMHQFIDIRSSLNPLIEKKSTLEKFIHQVNKQEMNEINAKDFTQKIEQLNFKIKDTDTRRETEMHSLACRLSDVESAIEVIREEISEVKLTSKSVAVDRSGKARDIASLTRPQQDALMMPRRDSR